MEGVELSWLAGHWLNINFGPGGDKPVLLLTLAVSVSQQHKGKNDLCARECLEYMAPRAGHD